VRAAFFIAAALLGPVGCSREAPAIRVGDREVTRPELARILEPGAGDSAGVNSLVENVIATELILMDASVRGIEILEQLHDRRRERLQSEYLRYKLGLILVPEDSVLSFYEASGTFAGFTVMNVGDSALAESLRAEVLAGAEMGSLVRAYSTLQTDVDAAGRVEPRDMQRMSQGDREMLEGLAPGGISAVTSAASGWRFVRLDTLYSVEMPPFEDARQAIYDFIWAHMAESYKRTLDDSLRTAWELTVADGVPAMVASHAIDPSGNFTPYSASDDSLTAYSWRGGRRTVGALARNIRSIPAFMPRNATDPDWVSGYCSILGLYDIMASRALEMRMDTLPDLADQMRRACDEVVLDAWYAEVLEPRLTVTDEEIEAVWEQNRASLTIPERRSFLGVVAVGQAQVERLGSLVSEGRDPLASASELTLLSSLLAPGESLLTRPLSAADLPGDVAADLFALQPGGVALCTLQGGAVAYLRLSEVLPAREATLEESRDQLASMLRQGKETAVLGGLVDSLRSAYPCEVDWEFVSRFRTASSGSR
jgi:hypothetical protein